MQTTKDIVDGILKLALIAVLGLFVYFVIGIAIALGGSSPSKSTSTQPASVTPAVTTTTPVSAPAAPSEASAQASVNPIWTAESTVACDHEDAATGTLSPSCVSTMQEVCNTPVDEASPAIVSDEETLKTNACKMEALGAVQNGPQEEAES